MVRNRRPRNVAASVRDRLLDRSRKTREDFQFLLQRYASERFLHRLGESARRDRYILKGAMLFALWGGAAYRATRDLDFAGYGSSEASGVLAAMREVCAVPVAEDGLVFDAGTLTAEPIRGDAEYHGLRVQFEAMLGVARIPMQVDIGFGNAIEPPATEADYPTLLDMPTPRIRAYPQEAVVAEKLHAMVVLGERNSRYKDFYDLLHLRATVPVRRRAAYDRHRRDLRSPPDTDRRRAPGRARAAVLRRQRAGGAMACLSGPQFPPWRPGRLGCRRRTAPRVSGATVAGPRRRTRLF